MDRIKYIGFDMDYTLVGEFNVICTVLQKDSKSSTLL